MSFLRKFFKDLAATPAEFPVSAAPPDSSGTADPIPEDEPRETAEQVAEDAESAADSEAQAQQAFNEAETLYHQGEYDQAADQYYASYKSANTDQRGSLAYNAAQANRRAKKFSYALVWYQKALTLGGPDIEEHRAEIEQHIAEMQEEMQKNPATGPDGESLGEAMTLYQEAEIAYAERDFAGAVALYKQAYSRSNEPALLFNIAQASRNAGKYGDAKYWYREFLKQMPDSPDRAFVDERIEEMKQKVPDPPEADGEEAAASAEEKFQQAEQLYKTGNYDQAADLYAEVYHDPAVAFARGEMAFNMGQCMRNLGNTSSAVAWYRKASEFFNDGDATRAQIDEFLAKLTGVQSPPT